MIGKLFVMVEEEQRPATRERLVGTTVRLAMVIQVTGVLLGYGLQFLLARWLGSREYGVYASTVAWSTGLAFVAAVGLPMSALRFIPEYIAKMEWGSVKGFLRFGYAVSLMFSTAVVLGCWLILTFDRALPAPTRLALTSCLWLTPLVTLSSVQSQLCRGFKWIVTAFAFPLIQQPVLTGIAAFALSRSAHLTSTGALAALGLSVAVSIVAQGIVLAGRLPGRVRSASASAHTRTWVDVTVPLWIICGFFVVLDRLDILLVTWRLGPTAAGLYNAASVSGAMVALSLASVNSIAAPTYASLYAQGKIDDMQRLASKVAHWITWPAVGVLAVLAIFGRPILSLFGPDFGGAQGAMVALGCGQLVNAGCGSVGFLLGLTGHQKESMRVLGWTALINVGLNLVGISFLGLLGAAIGTAVSMAIWNLWLYRLVVHHVRVRPSIVDAFQPAPHISS